MLYQLNVGLTTKAGRKLDPAQAIGVLATLVSQHGFDGCTFLRGIGMWQGKLEDCVVIQIVESEFNGTFGRMNTLGQGICHALSQECVLWSQFTSKGVISCNITAPAHIELGVDAAGYYEPLELSDDGPFIMEGFASTADGSTSWRVLNGQTGGRTPGRNTYREAYADLIHLKTSTKKE